MYFGLAARGTCWSRRSAWSTRCIEPRQLGVLGLVLLGLTHLSLLPLSLILISLVLLGLVLLGLGLLGIVVLRWDERYADRIGGLAVFGIHVAVLLRCHIEGEVVDTLPGWL